MGQFKPVMLQLLSAFIIGAVVMYGTVSALDKDIGHLKEGQDRLEEQQRVQWSEMQSWYSHLISLEIEYKTHVHGKRGLVDQGHSSRN